MITKTVCNTIGFTGDEKGYSIQVTSLGEYIVLGSTTHFGSGDVLLSKFYSNLTLSWSTVVGNSEDYVGFSVQEIRSGGFIVTGVEYIGARKYALLSKFHSNGSHLWSSSIGSPTTNLEGYSVQETMDSGFIISGKALISGRNYFLVAKYFPNGTISWSRCKNKKVENGYSILEAKNGNFVVVCLESIESGISRVVLLKINPEGNIMRKTVFKGGMGDVCRDVKETASGSFILVGSTESFGGGGYYDLLLLKYSFSFEFEWVSIVGTHSGDEKGYSVQVTSDDGYAVTGYTESFGSGQHALLGKFSSNGTLEWVSIFGEVGGNEEGRSLVVVEDEGSEFFVVAGSSSSFGSGYNDAFISTVSDTGEGCAWRKVPLESFSSREYISVNDEGYYEYLLDSTWSATRVRDDYFSSQFTYPTFKDVTDTVNVGTQCSSFRCDEMYEPIACSGKGLCVNVDVCDCNQNYHGDNCEVNSCFGVLSNESTPSDVCYEHGNCIGFDECGDCFSDFFGDVCDLKHPVSFYSTFLNDGVSESGKSVYIDSNDGGFVVAGGYYDIKSRILISKFFPNGSFQWGFHFGYISRHFYVKHISEMSDGSILVSGRYDNVNPQDAIVLKFHMFSNGSIDSQNSWGVYLDGTYTYSVEETSDNGIITTGTLGINLALYKYFSDGSLEFGISLGGTLSDVGYSVQETTDGYIVSGFTQNGGVGGLDILLAKFFLNGTLNWASTLGGHLNEEAYSVRESLLYGEEGFVVVGYTNSFGEGDKDVLLAKFDPDGYLLWCSTVGGISDDIGYSLAIINDGGEVKYVVVGETNSYLTRDMLLLVFDENGELEKAYVSKEHPGGVERVAYDVKETGDGGLIISGMEVDGTEESTFLMKTYRDKKTGSYGSNIFSCKELIEKTQLKSYYRFGFSNLRWTTATFSDESASLIVGLAFTSYPSFFSTYVNETDLMFDMKCMVEYGCFGVLEMGEQCGGNGECVDDDLCVCDYNSSTPSQNHFGEECVLVYCFNILSNDTENVCNAHGECVSFDECVCNDNYTFSRDCSAWKCFGIWKNDTSRVCNGISSRKGAKYNQISHGNCTSHDHCECMEGYRSSLSCDWDCYGYDSWEDDVCGMRGECIDHDTCDCNSTGFYVGKYCDIPTCGNLSNSDDDVCSGHGICKDANSCDCDLGYSTTTLGFCDWWTCHGTHWSEKASVCSQHGNCVALNKCSCRDEYENEDCAGWSCGGENHDSPSVCSNRGKCVSPSECKCKTGFRGKSCNTNLLYGTVMAPVLSTSFVFVGFLFFICLVWCCCIICFICVCVCCVGASMMVYLFSQKKTLQRFSKLKNFDILLKEQELDNDSSIAHIRIDKSLFHVPYKDINIKKILGEGGSNSVVYLAEWEKQSVAFKCFKTRHIANSQEEFDEFEREVSVMSSVSHPNIIRFFGACLDPPRVGILMEYCENGDLEMFLKKRIVDDQGYPFNEKIRMIMEISYALSYLHGRSVIHRDLKLENVLVDSKERTKLMDFGLSKVISDLSQKNTKKIGTNIYMSPEISTSGRYDEKSDIFSVSIMMFIIFTEEFMPYEKLIDDRNAHTIELKVAQDPNFRPDLRIIDTLPSSIVPESLIVRKKLKILISQCWNHDPNDRYSSEEISGNLELLKKMVEEGKDGVVQNAIFSNSEDLMMKEAKQNYNKEATTTHNYDWEKKVKELQEEVERLKKIIKNGE